jgi:hypothetical protein
MPYPLAASVAVAPLVSGIRRTVRVAAVAGPVVYFASGDRDRPAFCLMPVGSEATRMPFALFCNEQLTHSVTVGQHAVVGAGELALGRATGRVARWWRPVGCPNLTGSRATNLRIAAGRIATRIPDPFDEYARSAIAALEQALACDGPLGPPAVRLVGRGPGLTPLGDDVLVGALATLRALGVPAADRLDAAIHESQTTVLSTALLRHAARGECVPELVAVLTGARDGRSDPLDALLAVGHSSGTGMAHGVLAVLSAALLKGSACAPR